MDRISFRLDPALGRRLEDEARAAGVSPSDLALKVVREHLERLKPAETCHDVAKRLGIIGVYRDTPADLSANPVHMEGFGGGG